MLFDLTGHATKHDRLKRALSFIRFGSYYAVLASVIERKKKKKSKQYYIIFAVFKMKIFL